MPKSAKQTKKQRQKAAKAKIKKTLQKSHAPRSLIPPPEPLLESVGLCLENFGPTDDRAAEDLATLLVGEVPRSQYGNADFVWKVIEDLGLIESFQTNKPPLDIPPENSKFFVVESSSMTLRKKK
ncbi:hypothetical protein MP228_012540 [Amoeboaphelidium protococcarum]|nr:hypothetical protein MP228_012540 [Amoeboaphelidium protococcarum]